mmetsp:Transcript_20527/g.44833  ORF Transcript_20527/g.44833 Transcript_20527/m.44833 type:complete len:234 (+) Transcript_20527:1672-2373(+)
MAKLADDDVEGSEHGHSPVHQLCLPVPTKFLKRRQIHVATDFLKVVVHLVPWRIDRRGKTQRVKTTISGEVSVERIVGEARRGSQERDRRGLASKRALRCTCRCASRRRLLRRVAADSLGSFRAPRRGDCWALPPRADRSNSGKASDKASGRTCPRTIRRRGQRSWGSPQSSRLPLKVLRCLRLPLASQKCCAGSRQGEDCGGRHHSLARRHGHRNTRLRKAKGQDSGPRLPR